jgi:signal transduction histidine kinase/ActR/RegA family two-component response regulator
MPVPLEPLRALRDLATVRVPCAGARAYRRPANRGQSGDQADAASMTRAPTDPGTAPARPYRLQTRIGLSLGALVLVSAAVLAEVLFQAAERRILRLSAENLENLSLQMGRELSAGMDGFARAVLDQSVRERFTEPDATPAEMRAALEQFHRSHPEFAYVSVVDAATARVVAAGGGVFEGGSAAGRPTFEEGRKGLFLGDVHEAVRLAELLPRPANGEVLRFLDVAAPIRDASGGVIRVLATHVGWVWTDTVRERVFGPVTDRRGVEVFLIDTEGKVVLQGSPRIAVGASLASLTGALGPVARRVDWKNEGAYLTVAADVTPAGRFDGFGWKVVARQPFELAYGPARDLRSAFLAGAAALGLAAAAIAWLVAAHLTRPVRLLAEAARNTGTDAEVAPLPFHGHVGEVSDVHGAIARLSDAARARARAAELKDREFAVLAESLPHVVWQADAEGRLQYVNRDWIRADGPQALLRVADFERLIHADDRDAFRQAWSGALARASDLRLRVRLHPADAGQPRWFDFDARAVEGERPGTRHWVGTLFDVDDMVTRAALTERRLLEERVAREEAERLTRMRDEFMATVSHELRSPLSAITGWSDILLRKGGADETLSKAAAVIRRNALLQARLIDDLLDMTAVLAGKLTLSSSHFDLVALVREVALSFTQAAREKGVMLTCGESPPASVVGDPKRIAQVLSNVLGNAVKFTDTGGRIEVEAWADREAGHVKVTDTGRGISPSFLPHVFDRMRQEDGSIRRQAGGLGIGLAIAKAVVELHGGAIRADSRGLGAGTTFTISLPLASSDAPEPAAEPVATDSSQVDLSGTRVLLVDDELDAREVAQVTLASLGAMVSTAASAAEALRMLAHGRFDALVSDIGMPVMDGLALIDAVRRLPDPATREIAAVALTAFAMESQRRTGLDAGFDVYVAKPISMWRLGQAIRLAQSARRQRATSG